jgi:ribosomal protein S11
VSARGHVVAQKDDSQVVYVRDTAGDNTVIVTDHAGAVAIATVAQPSGAALTISAAPSTLSNNGDQSILTVSGGAPTYTWSLATGSRGTLSATTGATVIYTRSTSGNQVVTVTDSNGSVTSMTISQPSTSSLRATAAPASLSADGAKSILTATGGNPPYTWSVGDDSLGGLSANTGTTVTYTRNSSGGNVITVTDQDGSRYSFIINQP